MQRLTSYTESWNRRPLPGPLGAGPPPTVPQAAVISALWLLAAWSPATAPGWRASFALDDPSQWGTAEPVPDPDLLLAGRLPAGDARSRSLQRYLASELDSKYVQLRRAPAPGDDLTLLLRDWKDRTLRLTLSAAPSVEPPPPDSRLPCLMTLLSDQLWVNNNNPVTFRAFLADRDGPVDPIDWWTRTREDAPLEDDDEPEFAPIAPDDLRSALLNVARGGLTELGADWDGTGDYPAIPDDHIAAYLCHDLLDTLLDRVQPESLHGTGFLPVDFADEDMEAEIGTVVLAGPREVAVLDIDVTC
ncbi:hypothetical protein [Dactylosporangium sp. CA-139066]|uniref:hypothetical protein n=1 Tax=Dactylosporangium sp. CA-139066 TaxID=3239930 RepID=UPI003D921C6B